MTPSAMPDSSAASAADLLTRSARCYPDRPAVIIGGRTWSYGELLEAARTAASGLQRAGVEAGDSVLMAMPNGAAFLSVFFGALIAGAVAVPVFPGGTPDRIGTMARLADASVVVVPASSPAGQPGA